MDEHASAEVSWAGYRRLVLDGLERIERRISDIDIKIDREIASMESKFDRKNDDQDKAILKLEVEVGKLKVWSALSGIVAGAVMSSFITALAQFVFKGNK